MSTSITVVGNLTADPDLRFTPAGMAVASMTVAVNDRTQDPDTKEWKDADPAFHRITAWRGLAENVAESLRKGDRVIVTGRLIQRHWTDEKTNEKRSAWQVNAASIGPDLTWAVATVTKKARRDEIPPDDAWATATPEPPPGY